MYVINRIKALKLIILFAAIPMFVLYSFHIGGFSLEKLLITLLLLSSVILLITFSLIKREAKHYTIHPYFKVLFFLLFIWSFFIILRSLSFNITDLMSLFGRPLFAWAWITPLMIVFGFNILNWIYIFKFLGKILLIGSILAIGLIIPFWDKYVFGLSVLLKFYPVLFLTFSYQTPRYKKITLLAMFCFGLVAFVSSQRIAVAYFLLTLFFFSIEFFKNKHVGHIKKILVATTLALSIVLIFVMSSEIYNDIASNKTATTDTRTLLFIEMFDDMSENEVIIGRGVLGTYYSPYFYKWSKAGFDNGDSAIRQVVEVGYLQMILKGGLIMMFLYLLILIPAAYLAIFRSNNLIAKMSGYWIVLYLITWTISYVPFYSPVFLLLWMATGTAISKEARKITDDELQKYINTRNMS